MLCARRSKIARQHRSQPKRPAARRTVEFPVLGDARVKMGPRCALGGLRVFAVEIGGKYWGRRRVYPLPNTE
jgi:hypothetical protein